MTSTRVPTLPTNLKERIAAIEQKVGNAGPSARSISPAPGVAPIAPTTAGALRDKIAKFEGKGGIPVPRSRFGLGAPPTAQAPQRNGELYGNRIPAPMRSVSNTVYPASRAASPTSDMSPHTSPGDRRSFSLSSVVSDFDDRDYTPVGSPTFAFPLDSPESVLSMPNTPEISPLLGTNGNGTTFTKNIGIVRATSFQKALEIARNAESAKLEALDPAVASVLRPPRSLDEEEENVEAPEPTPVIVVSSEEAETVVVHESLTLESTPPATISEPVEESSHQEPPSDASAAQHQPMGEAVEAKVTEPSVPDTAPIVVEEAAQVEKPKVLTPVVPVVIEVTPLSFRKRRGTISRQDTEIISSEPIPPLPISIAQVPQKLSQDLHVAHLSSPEIVAKSDTFLSTTTPQVELSQTDKSTSSILDAGISSLPEVDIKEEVPSLKASTPPQIVVHNVQPASDAAPSNEVISERQQNDFNSRNASLTLDANLINSESLMSPPLATGVSGVSITDVLGNYYTGGLATGDESKFEDIQTTTTPPPFPDSSPLSPPARLAYDSPEASPSDLASLPVPAARPRNKTPEPLNFLSPPASGAPSAAGSSMGSMSTTLSSRPMSMIETSPSLVTRAMRMTPATSRGVPVFVPPPSSQPRKSDFVYFPPTPDAEESEFGEMRATGNGTMHKASQSLSEGTRQAAEPDVFEGGVNQATFSAVVHGKVREASVTLPSTRRYVVPATPQVKRVKRQTMAEPPLSPGQGELAALLQEAMLLEDTLSKGELPAEIVQQKEVDGKERVELEAIEEEKVEKAKNAKEEDEERRRIAQAAAQLQAKRHEPTSGKLKHTFLIPLTKARSVHRSEGSTSSRSENFSSRKEDVDALRPKSAGVPDTSAARAARPPPLPTAGPSQAQHEPPPMPIALENPDTAHPAPELPPKSSRFPSFRRLGSISRPSTMYGSSSSVRHSQSTSSEISSEDSQAVVTPPEAHLEFGVLKNISASGEYGHGNGSTTSFPSLSPKKSGSNLGRAASFAEKMWSRARTKSSTSTLSVAASELTIDDVPRLPTFDAAPALQIPSLPSVPVVVPPSPERKSNLVLQPPKRSTSLKRSTNLPPIPIELVPPIPPIPSTFQFHSQVPSDSSVLEISSDSLFPPGSAGSSRPTSWTSLSSAGSLGSLPSPLFDKEFFDAFPSVPGSTPMPDITTVANFPHRRDGSTSSAFANPSFDTALLSSAIHLASAHKSAAAPSTTTLHQQHAGTPTTISASLPRQSVDSAR